MAIALNPFRAIAFYMLLAVSVAPSATFAQDRLKTMPGYERHQRITRASSNAFKTGAISATWTNDGAAFIYRRDNRRFLYDLAARRATELAPSTNRSMRSARPRNVPRPPLRGRQYTKAISPDKKFTAEYRDRNVWLTTEKDT
ncbi:MAG TPA: hypothetical protein VEA63_03355, partial [Opitutus sp.]|nr:hypothetical protein [Opitutus sp.]